MKRGFWADLFTTVCNCHWELGRILSGVAFLGVNLLALYMAYKGNPPTLDQYTEAHLKLFTGCALFIGGKDAARAFAIRKANEGAEQP